MNHTDLLRALKDVDPARKLPTTAGTAEALDAMRTAITVTEPGSGRPTGSRRHRRRRAILAGGTALAMTGLGGAAYAAYERWSPGGGELVCMTHWVDLGTSQVTDTIGGPAISGDPVGDCQRYQERAGLPPIEDPVAVDRGWSDRTIVAPRAEVPSGEVLASKPGPDVRAMLRLERSLRDYVDGGNSRCFDSESGLAWSRAEAVKLGLPQVRVEEQKLGPDTPTDESCGWFLIDDKKTVLFSPGRQKDPNDLNPAGGVVRIRDDLRKEVAGKCLALPAARKVVDTILEGESHWPTGAEVDESEKCTQVDLVAGGDIQIFLRGPSVARP